MLSGGEKAQPRLAKFMLSAGTLLVLDELLEISYHATDLS